MNFKHFNKEEKAIILFIPLIYIGAALVHVIYDLSGQNIVVGLFTPVNESIWEHIKLMTISVMAFWNIYYILRGRKLKINPNKWFMAGFLATIISMLLVPFLFYFYSGAFGIHSLVIDIINGFIAVVIGQFMGLHYYRHGKGRDYIIPIVLYIVILIIFMYFTVRPVKIPLFLDGPTGTYGIPRGR